MRIKEKFNSNLKHATIIGGDNNTITNTNTNNNITIIVSVVGAVATMVIRVMKIERMFFKKETDTYKDTEINLRPISYLGLPARRRFSMYISYSILCGLRKQQLCFMWELKLKSCVKLCTLLTISENMTRYQQMPD